MYVVMFGASFTFEMWHIIMLKRFIHVFALIMWSEIKIYAMPARVRLNNVFELYNVE